METMEKQNVEKELREYVFKAYSQVKSIELKFVGFVRYPKTGECVPEYEAHVVCGNDYFTYYETWILIDPVQVRMDLEPGNPDDF